MDTKQQIKNAINNAGNQGISLQGILRSVYNTDNINIQDQRAIDVCILLDELIEEESVSLNIEQDLWTQRK